MSTIETLCDVSRFARRRHRLLAILASPVLLLVLLIRLAVVPPIMLAAYLGPARFRQPLNRLFVRTIGAHWRVHGAENLPPREAGPAIVAFNHVSLYDAFVILALDDMSMVASDPKKNSSRAGADVFTVVQRCFRQVVHVLADRRALVSLLRTWRAEPAPRRIAVAPEGTVGSGRALFRFEKGFLNLGVPVVPLAIRARPLLPMTLHPAPPDHYMHFLWLLLQPVTRFDLTFLPPMQREPDEDPNDFAMRVAKAIGDHLDIPATTLGRAEKAAFRARLRADGTTYSVIAPASTPATAAAE